MEKRQQQACGQNQVFSHINSLHPSPQLLQCCIGTPGIYRFQFHFPVIEQRQCWL